MLLHDARLDAGTVTGDFPGADCFEQGRSLASEGVEFPLLAIADTGSLGTGCLRLRKFS